MSGHLLFACAQLSSCSCPKDSYSDPGLQLHAELLRGIDRRLVLARDEWFPNDCQQCLVQSNDMKWIKIPKSVEALHHFESGGSKTHENKNSKTGHLKKQKAGCKSSGESNPQNRIGQQGIVSVSSPKMAQQIATEVGKWPNKSGLFYYYLCADNVAETQDHDFRYCFFLCVFVRVEFHEFSWISDKYNIH